MRGVDNIRLFSRMESRFCRSKISGGRSRFQNDCRGRGNLPRRDAVGGGGQTSGGGFGYLPGAALSLVSPSDGATAGDKGVVSVCCIFPSSAIQRQTI